MNLLDTRHKQKTPPDTRRDSHTTSGFDKKVILIIAEIIINDSCCYVNQCLYIVYYAQWDQVQLYAYHVQLYQKTIVNFLNIRLPYDDNSTLMIDLFVLYLVGEQIGYIAVFGCSVTS